MSELINKITEIANAIRTKKNTTEKIPLVNFPSEILSIETKSDPVIEELTVTENGTYTVPSGTDGYNPVVVNVPTGGGGEKVEIENADSLFSECKFYQGIFNMCDFTNATDFTNAFYSSDVESISFTTWPTSKFVKIDYMFNSCPSLISVDFSLLDVMRIESASRTFAASNLLQTVILPNCYFNTSTVDMFYDTKENFNNFLFKDGCTFMANMAQTLNLTKCWRDYESESAISGFTEFANTIGSKVGAYNKTIKIYTYLYNSPAASDAISTLTDKGYIVSYGN